MDSNGESSSWTVSSNNETDSVIEELLRQQVSLFTESADSGRNGKKLDEIIDFWDA